MTLADTGITSKLESVVQQPNLAAATAQPPPQKANKMSTLMFWNKQNGHDAKSGKKTWLHAPDNLVDGHIVYRAKVNHRLRK